MSCLRQAKSGGLRKSSEYWSSQAPRMEEMVLQQGGKHKEDQVPGETHVHPHKPRSTAGTTHPSQRAATRATTAQSDLLLQLHPLVHSVPGVVPIRLHVEFAIPGGAQRAGTEHPALSCLSQQPPPPPHHPQLCQGVGMNLLRSVLLPSLCHNLPVTGTGKQPALATSLEQLRLSRKLCPPCPVPR